MHSALLALGIRRHASLLALLASVAFAGGTPWQKTAIRSIVLSDEPSESTQAIYVSGEVASVLRFEQEPNPAKTKILGWEGRFEPLLVGSHKVVVVPLRDLAKDERASLVVTLADGTQIPFLLCPEHKDWGTDHQVSVFQYNNTYGAVRFALNEALKRERVLREENERFKANDRSGDHALAAVLMNDDAREVRFKPTKTTFSKNDGLDIHVEILSSPGKAAATVITLTNGRNSSPWRFGEARVSTDRSSLTARPFSFTIDRDDIGPGERGKISIVVDKEAFVSPQGLVDLAVQVFRDDGLQQLVVNLDHTLVEE